MPLPPSTAPAMAAAAPDARPVPVRVWDLPTRLFHAVLALAVAGAVVTAKIGGDAMAWHFRCGYTVLALLAFRLAWGLVGGRWSRFAAFVRGPGTVWRFVRGRARPGELPPAGHSPLGALSVLALLAVLAAQVATGLVADDEIFTTGPLNRFVDGDTASRATAWHQGVGQYAVLALVGLHLAAIAVYRLRGADLVRPMVRGDAWLAPGVPASRDDAWSRALAAALAAAATAGVAWLASLGA